MGQLRGCQALIWLVEKFVCLTKVELAINEFLMESGYSQYSLLQASTRVGYTSGKRHKLQSINSTYSGIHILNRKW